MCCVSMGGRMNASAAWTLVKAPLSSSLVQAPLASSLGQAALASCSASSYRASDCSGRRSYPSSHGDLSLEVGSRREALARVKRRGIPSNQRRSLVIVSGRLRERYGHSDRADPQVELRVGGIPGKSSGREWGRGGARTDRGCSRRPWRSVSAGGTGRRKC